MEYKTGCFWLYSIIITRPCGGTLDYVCSVWQDVKRPFSTTITYYYHCRPCGGTLDYVSSVWQDVKRPFSTTTTYYYHCRPCGGTLDYVSSVWQDVKRPFSTTTTYYYHCRPCGGILDYVCSVFFSTTTIFLSMSSLCWHYGLVSPARRKMATFYYFYLFITSWVIYSVFNISSGLIVKIPKDLINSFSHFWT